MSHENQETRNIEELLYEIINRYRSSQDILISQAFLDGGTQDPAGRLLRAAENQACHGDGMATLSRYAIWANTVRDNIIEAARSIKKDPETSLKFLTKAVNNLSAFCDIQALFDPYEHGKKNIQPVKMELNSHEQES